MPTTSAISTAVAGLKFQIKQTQNGAAVFLKNAVTAYSVTGSSGAFNQITSANYPATTVPGAVYLNDYMFVQHIEGAIFNSSSGTILDWGSLDFITPEKEPSCAVAIAKSLNFLVAFKQWDTEFFYDPGTNTSPGSVLSNVEAQYLKLGCATADSIVEFDGGVVFMSKRDQAQRSREIHVLNGLTPKKISTAEVERILNADDLDTCYALYLSTAGHQFYVLTLKTTNITIVYDFNNGLWYQWSYLTIQSTNSVTTLTSSGVTATATATNHGYSDGDPVLIAGATPSGYNGTWNITKVDANTFTYMLDSALSSPATGTITAAGYDEAYFPAVAYATYNNLDLVLHETNGIIYALDADVYDDEGAPINFMMRTPNFDNGNLERKQMIRSRPITDLQTGRMYVRHTDDDYASYSRYEPVTLSNYETNLPTQGEFHRRAFELKYTSTTAMRVEAHEIDFKQGK
jgi:hypothetical protein